MATSFTYFTDHARAAVTGAATSGGVGWTTPVDLAVGLLRYPDGNVARWRREVGFDADQAVIDLGQPPDKSVASTRLRFDAGARRVLAAGVTMAVRNGANHVGTEHFLAAVVGYGPPEVVAAFRNQGITADSLHEYVVALGNDPGAERLVRDPGRRERRAWAKARTQLDASHASLYRPRRVSRRMRRRLWVIACVLGLLAVFVILSSR